MITVDEAMNHARSELERAFEKWLTDECPSGDCESVQAQWDDSFAHQELVDELQPVMALTAEVRRLQKSMDLMTAERDHWKANHDWALGEAKRLREENERIHAATPQQSPGPDCRTCANRGMVNGLSQETYCDGCVWYGAYWKKNHYNPIPEPAP